MLPQQYCLRWKYHHSNLQTMFSQLLDRGCFCDVTLSCEGQILKAHRVVLCACSTYFDTLLTNCSSEKDPIIIMKDAKFMDIKCLIEFMYKGEINVEHSNLASLLKTAEDLRIKGLAEVSWREDECNNNSDDATAETEPLPNQQQQMQQQQQQLQFQQLQQLHQQKLQSSDSPVPNLPLLAPITTIAKENGSPYHHPHQVLGKKRRGRPPLDDKYDSSPKMPHIDGGTPFTDSSQLVSVTMDENSRDHSIKGISSANSHNNLCTDLQMDFEEDGIARKIIPKIEMSDSQPEFGIRDDDEEFSGPLSPSEQNTSLQAIFLTAEEQEEWKDVIKMEDYLTKGRRPQFWEEPFTKRVMDAIKTKNLEMKKAAKLLGVSYGTLYGRYRETYGCLKHPYRSPFVNSRLRDVWPTIVTATEQGATEVLAMLHRGHITLDRAAELMNTSAATVTTYLDQMQDLFTSSTDNDGDDGMKQQSIDNLLEAMNENKPQNVLDTVTTSSSSASPSSISIKLSKRN